MPLRKLLQEPHISIEEQLNIVDAIFQNCDAFDAHAKRKPADFPGIVIHEAINIRIDHAATQQLNPTAGLAVPAWPAVAVATAATKNAADLHIRAGLGKREK